jgi:hypothetical protein
MSNICLSKALCCDAHAYQVVLLHSTLWLGVCVATCRTAASVGSRGLLRLLRTSTVHRQLDLGGRVLVMHQLLPAATLLLP